VGLTKNIEKRMQKLGKEYDIIRVEYEKLSMLEVAIKERAYHHKFINNRHHHDISFDGSTECYLVDILHYRMSINEALDILEANNYSISKNVLKLIIKERNEIKRH
jgi:hypothetical protein